MKIKNSAQILQLFDWATVVPPFVHFQKIKKPEAFPLQAFWHPHSESNQELIFRRDLLYPFNYEGSYRAAGVCRLAYVNILLFQCQSN